LDEEGGVGAMLGAMLQAADRVQPALDEFYATLSSEQKTRFNTMPRVAGQ
jgi:LTXXQ motif family protein